MRVRDALRLLRSLMSSATLVACYAAQRATVVKPGWQRHGLGLANWVGGIILPAETRYNVYRYVRCETMQRTLRVEGYGRARERNGRRCAQMGHKVRSLRVDDQDTYVIHQSRTVRTPGGWRGIAQRSAEGRHCPGAVAPSRSPRAGIGTGLFWNRHACSHRADATCLVAEETVAHPLGTAQTDRAPRPALEKDARSHDLANDPVSNCVSKQGARVGID